MLLGSIINFAQRESTIFKIITIFKIMRKIPIFFKLYSRNTDLHKYL